MWTILLFSIIGAVFASSNNFDWSTGNTSVRLSGMTYCDSSTYLTNNYTDTYVDTFEPTYQIYNKHYDVNGFIGVRHSDETIYVVFRGTQSTKDWIDDFKIHKIDYVNPSCQVHRGFYDAEQSVIDDAIEEVERLQFSYPSYRIVVTGHSLGAALATLAAVDLIEYGFNSYLFNYGCPRLFDDNCAEFVSNTITDRVRVTHCKDIVPHVPPPAMGYTHISGEWYEDENGTLKSCEGYEDETCADQWKITNADDHMWYLGFYLGCY